MTFPPKKPSETYDPKWSKVGTPLAAQALLNHAPRQRRASGLTIARAVGLASIGIVALALLFLRISSADSKMAVPEGAQAGDLRLQPCTYSTPEANYQADCGTLVVPENRQNPNSRLIALPM